MREGGPGKKYILREGPGQKEKLILKGRAVTLGETLYYLFLTFMFWLLLLPSFLVRKVITNDQRLTEHSHLYISNTLLSILAVPKKALFCITPTLLVMLSFPIHLSNSAETLPRAPITTGTISTFLNFHNLLISFFKFWYFSSFSFSFSFTLTSAGTAISIIMPFCFFLSITSRSGHHASIRLLHWIFMP